MKKALFFIIDIYFIPVSWAIEGKIFPSPKGVEDNIPEYSFGSVVSLVVWSIIIGLISKTV